MGKFQHIQHKVHINNVLLVKIEGPGAGIPSIITKTCKGVSPTPSFSSTNQWEFATSINHHYQPVLTIINHYHPTFSICVQHKVHIFHMII